MKYTLSLIIFFALSISISAQRITGNFSMLSNQEIKLEGFNGLNTYTISTVVTDVIGNFQLQYTNDDFGVGYLISTDNKPLIVILNGEDLELIGESLSRTESIQVIKGQENQWFVQYAEEHKKREQALSAWVYLDQIYTLDSLFAVQPKPRQAIIEEKTRIKDEDENFLLNLSKASYVSWFLPVRKLISSVSIVAQYRTNEISSTINAFRKLDYTDPKLYKSGLFKDAIESHFWLIENSGRSLDSVFIEMKFSIDAMLTQLVKDEKKLNEVVDYLFDLLERHSLFQASEYLALKVLNETSCTINTGLTHQLEAYRAMKKGNIAPDIQIDKYHFVGGDHASVLTKLSDLQSNFTLVTFGASWCPKCTEELMQIVQYYPNWKSQGVEVLFVSLDDDKKIHQAFVDEFPFICINDFNKWDSQSVKDYHVFATPTMFLLDKNRKILLKPISATQMEAWVDWVIVKGNKLKSDVILGYFTN